MNIFIKSLRHDFLPEKINPLAGTLKGSQWDCSCTCNLQPMQVLVHANLHSECKANSLLLTLHMRMHIFYKDNLRGIVTC